MEAIVEDLSQSRKLIRFSIPQERVAEEIEAALGAVKKTASVKGFRPGHVPERILRTRFGETIRKEALSRLVPQVFRQAMVEHKLRAIGEPEVKDLSFRQDEPLTFTATVEVLPDFELPDYKGIRVVAHKIDPPAEQEIDQVIDNYRQSRAVLTPVEGRPVKMGDSIVVTIEQTIDGEAETMTDRTVEVAEESLIPGLAAQLAGIECGATKQFELSIPDDFANAEIAGKTIAFTTTVSEIKQKQLPELNDGFAKEVADADSVDALRDKIREMLVNQRTSEERRRQENVVLEALADRAAFEVPESLMKAQIERNVARAYQRAQYSGIPREKVVEQHDEIVKNASVAAARQIKLTLLFERIAEAEGIAVTDDDVGAYFEQAAAMRGGGTADEVRALYEKQDGMIESLRDELLEGKVRSFLMEHAEIE